MRGRCMMYFCSGYTCGGFERALLLGVTTWAGLCAVVAGGVGVVRDTG